MIRLFASDRFRAFRSAAKLLGQWSHAAGFRRRLSIRATRVVAAQHRRHGRLDERAARYARYTLHAKAQTNKPTLRITTAIGMAAPAPSFPSRPTDSSIPCNSALKCAAPPMPSNRQCGMQAGGAHAQIRPDSRRTRRARSTLRLCTARIRAARLRMRRIAEQLRL